MYKKVKLNITLGFLFSYVDIYVQKDKTYLRPFPVPVRSGLTTGDTAMLSEAEAAPER